MIYAVIGIMAAVIIALLIKIYLLKRSAKEIAEGFADKLQTDTNTLISISSGDKDMRMLADSINQQLKILRREYHLYTQGDKELKNAVTNISHDLRTPLTAICGYLDIIKREELPPDIKQYLDIISERAGFMRQLTEELFRYSVILSQGASADTEDVYVNQLLAESTSGYYAVLTEHNIEPQIHITDKKIIRRLNKGALSRVFSNLLGNAVKYCDGDLEITLSDNGEIVFANTAKGLSVVQVQKLFDRFFTVETARNSTGLGLSIVKALVEQMEGKISAEYKNDKLYIKLIF